MRPQKMQELMKSLLQHLKNVVILTVEEDFT